MGVGRPRHQARNWWFTLAVARIFIAPLIEQFATSTGIDVEVRYGGTAEMAATIMEEGQNSPVDIFFGQDAGALGALAKAGRLAPLPPAVLDLVPANLRSEDGVWVGVSGRARCPVYNTDLVAEAALPDDVWGLTAEEWRGRGPAGHRPMAAFRRLSPRWVVEGEDRAA